jgi:aerobic C4-dicarboxylate transport protein
LIVGIDRFMSECRTITNLIGNGVGTVAVAAWDGALDRKRMMRVLDGETPEEADHPEDVLVAEELAGIAGRQ